MDWNEFMLNHIEREFNANDKKLKTEAWQGIVIHHTGIGDRDYIEHDDIGTWDKLYTNLGDWLAREDEYYLSSHFLIGRYGGITQLVNPETHIAYHAGKSKFWHPKERKIVEGCNDFMIGIELLGDGNKMEYSEEQYDTLSFLCTKLISYFQSIKPNLIVGHEMIAPDRKVDPGRFFNWRYFYSCLLKSKLIIMQDFRSSRFRDWKDL